MSLARLRGGVVYDPANGVNGERRDVYFRDGRIVDGAANAPVDHDYDASGMVVMAGGIDLHSHIGGGKTNLSRLLLPEDHRADAAPFTAPDPDGKYLRLPSCGVCTPGTLATGYRYAEMGYTAAFEPAMMPSNARHTHLEMGDTPIIDHGAYVMMGNDELFLQMLAARDDFERLRDYIGWTIHASKALGVKVVNPGGISAFKFNQRSLNVDEGHVHYGITPREVLATLTRALTELRVPHPLHVHASNLGVPGNIDSTIATMDAADGLPIHLTHIQFHSYGTEGPRKFSSGARAIAEAVNARPNVSIDVCQIIFGQTVIRRHYDAVQERAAREPAQVDRRRYRMRRGLRHRAVPLSRTELRERAAMDHRTGDFPARRRPVARFHDDRPSERRPVHELSASDPPSDGQVFPRRTARPFASGSEGCERAAGPQARVLAVRDRGHYARGTGAPARVEGSRPSRRGRGG
jgi:formylmethanofuran dehydrogenase subunit A